MPSYTALYKTKDGHKIVVRSLTPPPEKRKFKVAGGLRTFTRVTHKQHLQEVIIVAKAAKASKKKSTVTDDELEELEGLEELDELEDEDEDEADEEEPEDEDEDDEDEDEEPAPKKGKAKKPAAKAKPKQSRAAADGLVGTNELAEDLGITARELRMVLRKLREKDPVYAPNGETGRYQWASLKDPQVKKIKKAIDSGLHKQIRDESLQKLKDQKAAEKAAASNDASTKTKKGKKDKKKKKVADDE